MGNRPKRDDVFVVMKPFETVMHLYWRTPAMEERTVTLPEGLELKVIVDPTLVAREVKLQPIDINTWEPHFLDPDDLKHQMYGGYSFGIGLVELRTHCAPVPAA